MMMLQSIQSSSGEALELRPFGATARVPLVVSPSRSGLALDAALAAIRDVVERHLTTSGGLLLRGFSVGGVDGFRSFAAALAHPLLEYEFGSTPRSRVTEGVYSSTEYPAHQFIPLHNEQAYSRNWPMKIWFYCAIEPEHGGETPIADSREVYARMPAALRTRLIERRLMYVRNYGGGLDVPWSEVFNTSDRSRVEAYCREHGIECEWKSDGELRTRQICQTVAQHPRTKDWVWFNQAHLFHVSALPAEVREALLEVVEPEDLPRNVYYADGSPIEDSVLEDVRGVLETCKVTFSWQQDDILMLDNMLTAHARNPFQGKRKIVVAMAEGHSADDV
jgi:alpha-ketoglutarate-dependent taurine dioxygenase